jgi:FHS family L-fucose permease-like MFS transporter
MAILGGSVLPPLQGAIIDLGSVQLAGLSIPAVRASFILPFVSFVVIAIYGGRSRSPNLEGDR